MTLFLFQVIQSEDLCYKNLKHFVSLLHEPVEKQ